MKSVIDAWVKILAGGCFGHFWIYIGKCPGIVSAILLAQFRHRKMSVPLMFQLVRCYSILHTAIVRRGRWNFS